MISNKPTQSSLIALSLVAVIGVIIGLLLQSPEQSTPSALLPKQGTGFSATTGTPELDVLAQQFQQQLEQETLARQILQKEVAILSKRISILSGEKTKTTDREKSPTSQQTAADTVTGNAWFNQQALIDAGMAPTEAEQLKKQFEELELAKLYLRDQAIREGWAQDVRYRDERQKLEDQTDNIKQALDEDLYDAYLYASGQSNRVAVQGVLSGSSAGNAGMLSGDQVIRYNGQRIYNWRDLRDATTQGDTAETIALEVLRDDEHLELYVQRGPLGIRMTSISEAP